MPAVKEYLPLVIVGLSIGSAYALAGLGLVVTYTTSGIFNFAQGTIAAAGAYAFYELHVEQGLPTVPALAVSLLVVGPLFGLGLEVLARRLAPADTSAKIVASVGLLLAVRGLAVVRYGDTPLLFPQILPSSRFEVVGVSVGYDQVIVFVIALGVSAGLGLFFKRTTAGIAMRGVVDNPELVGLAGTNPAAVRRLAWLIGSSFAVLAGILLAPQLGLDATLLTLLVVQAFAGAAVGRFRSLPLTYLGCLLVGVVGSLSTRAVLEFNQPLLSGLPPSVPFLVLIVVLLVSPATDLGAETARRLSRARTSVGPGLRTLALAAAAVVMVAMPFAQPSRIPVFTSGLAHVVLFLSLALLVRTSGQVSLAHAGFFAVGAATFSHLVVDAGMPWPLAVAGAGLATVPIGLAVAVPAIRLSGLYLALATFGFGILLQRLGYTSFIMFGRDSSVPAPRPALFASDHRYYFAVLAAVLLASGLVYVVRRGRLGRLLRAMADAPVALAVGGSDVKTVRILVLALSAFLAGIAGALYGPVNSVVSGNAFDPFNSLLYLTVLAIAGVGEIRAAFMAAVLFAVVPSYLADSSLVEYLPVLFGAAAIVGSMPRQPRAVDVDPEAMARRVEARRARGPLGARLAVMGAGR
ncbi:MAG: ABC transporter permease subunit [Acidimicrobiales bacterium]